MATPADAGGTGFHVSVQIPAAYADAASGGNLQQRERALNRFVRVVAFWEWAGNAFGALAFLWATAVLLGGFSSDLKPLDFWLATVITFIESFRIFSRSYKLDNQWLFGTTRALRWINVSFARMLGCPQEGNEVVLIMGMWITFVSGLILVGPFLTVPLLVVMSKMQLRGSSQMTSRSRKRQTLQLWVVLTANLVIYVFYIKNLALVEEGYTILNYSKPPTRTSYVASLSAYMLSLVVAALLLIFRPPIIANITNTPWGRSLLSLAKVISALGLAFCLAVDIGVQVVDLSDFIKPFTIVVLSLGSLQTPAAANNLSVGCWIDVILHILFLFNLVIFPVNVFHGVLKPSLFKSLAVGITTTQLVAVLLIRNLQIPTAVIQVLLSSWRFQSLQSDNQEHSNPNILPAIKVFYVLALCQGSLYIMASILGLFSFFPRRLLVSQYKFRGEWGTKAIDLYYECYYDTCMDTGLLDARKTLSLASFAMDSLSSNSGEIRLAGVLILGNLLRQTEPDYSSQDLMSRIIRSNKIKIMLKSVPLLLDTDNQSARNEPGRQDTLLKAANSNGQRVIANQLPDQSNALQGNNVGYCYWVCQCWQQMKQKWAVLKELPLTQQDLFPILGMVILERLAHDLINCEEIVKSPYLISKIIGLINYTTDSENSNDEQQKAMICSSLNFVRRLAITGENIGVALRKELCKNPFLLNNLECVLEDSRSGPEPIKLVIDILAKLAWDEDARKEIGSSKVTICKLMHAFIGRDGRTNSYYDQSLRMAAGEALANLTIESPANCLAILEEPGYELIKDLKDMLCEDQYRYDAASLLHNVCAHSMGKLRHQDAGDHLSSVFSIVMKNIMSTGGKELEPLIGLLSKICDVIQQPCILELQLQTNGLGLVQKLVSTLNSNRKPCPEYPRIRRAIVELVISIVKFCPRYATIFREEGTMEALTKVERTPSKVEKFRVFYGNIGVVLESGPSLTALVAAAKELIHSAAQASAAYNEITIQD